MQKLLWILYILIFIVGACGGLKVSFTPDGKNVEHIIVSMWFYPSLILCFLIAFSFKFLQKESTDNEKSEHSTSISSSPDKYLESILLNYPENIEPEQKIIERIQSICLQMADERFIYIQKYGIQNFSEFFESFSHGERYLNRSWSALVDKHLEESKVSFQISQKYFEHALEKYKQL